MSTREKRAHYRGDWSRTCKLIPVKRPEITKTVVKQALDGEDIEGLLQLGAPKDEYSYEAEAISSRFCEADANEDAATEIIRAVWMKAFDLAAEDNEKRAEAYRRVAKRILSLIE